MDRNEFLAKADLCLDYYGEVMSGGHWKYFDDKAELDIAIEYANIGSLRDS
jgi:hypothetical protein